MGDARQEGGGERVGLIMENWHEVSVRSAVPVAHEAGARREWSERSGKRKRMRMRMRYGMTSERRMRTRRMTRRRIEVEEREVRAGAGGPLV